MTRVFVTGATGFLGGRLCVRLRTMGIDVVAGGRSDEGCKRLRQSGFAVLQHDLAGPFQDRARQILAQCDAVVHCAAMSLPFGRRVDFVRNNVTATVNLLAACKDAGVSRFVYISSPSVYFSFRDQMNVSELQRLPRPVNAYALSKTMAEQHVLSSKAFSTICLRPRGIYGHGDTTLLPRLLSVAKKRALPLLRNGRAKIDLTHVDDVVAAIVAALQVPETVSGEIFNISGGEVLPVRQIVDAVCERAGVVPKWRAMPLPAVRSAAVVAEAFCKLLPHQPEPLVTNYSVGLFAYEQSLDISKAEELLDWIPKVSFARGLEETFTGELMA